jgi:hypothetical protein
LNSQYRFMYKNKRTVPTQKTRDLINSKTPSNQADILSAKQGDESPRNRGSINTVRKALDLIGA